MYGNFPEVLGNEDSLMIEDGPTVEKGFIKEGLFDDYTVQKGDVDNFIELMSCVEENKCLFDRKKAVIGSLWTAYMELKKIISIS